MFLELTSTKQIVALEESTVEKNSEIQNLKETLSKYTAKIEGLETLANERKV